MYQVRTPMTPTAQKTSPSPRERNEVINHRELRKPFRTAMLRLSTSRRLLLAQLMPFDQAEKEEPEAFALLAVSPAVAAEKAS
jgi:hypothetical protein